MWMKSSNKRGFVVPTNRTSGPSQHKSFPFGTTHRTVGGKSRWRRWNSWGSETEADLRRGIISALRAIPEVTNVYEEDREVWGVDGNPSGDELVAAAADVVDQFADRIRIANSNVLETPPPGYPARPPRQQVTIEQLANTAVESITDEIRRMRGVQLDSGPESGGWSETQVENLSHYFEQLVEDIRAHPRSQRDQIDVKVIFDSVGMVELPPNGAVTVAAVRAASGFNNFARRAERMR